MAVVAAVAVAVDSPRKAAAAPAAAAGPPTCPPSRQTGIRATRRLGRHNTRRPPRNATPAPDAPAAPAQAEAAANNTKRAHQDEQRRTHQRAVVMDVQSQREKPAQAAEEMAQAAPFATRRVLFVSGENPDNVLKLRQRTRGGGTPLCPRCRPSPAGWYALMSDLPRHNSNGKLQAARFGAEHMVRWHLVQLLMALECDAWVGLRDSNWNRLIDELRCVLVPKCSHEYRGVGTMDRGYWW